MHPQIDAFGFRGTERELGFFFGKIGRLSRYDVVARRKTAESVESGIVGVSRLYDTGGHAAQVDGGIHNRSLGWIRNEALNIAAVLRKAAEAAAQQPKQTEENPDLRRCKFDPPYRIRGRQLHDAGVSFPIWHIESAIADHCSSPEFCEMPLRGRQSAFFLVKSRLTS
jgi:hypothetical protein